MAYGPIFIGGVSFSGKTELRLLLNLHSKILITRHTYFWRKYYGKFGDLNRSENLEQCLDALFASKQAAALEPNRQRILAEFTTGSADYSRLFNLLHQQHASTVGKSRWGIQQSFLECDSDLLFSDVPDARILHMIRSPFERIEESAGRSRRRPGKVGAETALWQLSARWADRNIRKYQDRYMIVHFEALVKNPEMVLRKVCDFIGVDYESGMLSASTPSATQPNGYRKLSRSEHTFIQAWTRREMSQLDYPTQQNKLSAGDVLSLALCDYPVNTAVALFAGKTSKFPSPPTDLRNKGSAS